MEMKTQTALQKPKFGEPCNSCGYCCTMQPCQLANEFLHCMTGPCIALETENGNATCGFVRNPLGYLFKAAHPHEHVSVLEAPFAAEASNKLSSQIAAALGIGLGCDAVDDEESAAWPVSLSTRNSE